ncbi:MAG TPA: hypothetical protein VEG60_14825 [Candidatus Binatia bacterium]|nr:hypothetical protein [Candidatus Binatia bacterium]
MGVKADEFKWRSPGSSDDSLNIAIGDAHEGVATAIAATGATKLQVLLPVLGRQCSLRLAVNWENEKSAKKFIATLANISYTVGHGRLFR